MALHGLLENEKHAMYDELLTKPFTEASRVIPIAICM